MSTKFTASLQIIALMLIIYGWAHQSPVVVGVGMATAVIGALNYVRLLKAGQRQDKG